MRYATVIYNPQLSTVLTSINHTLELRFILVPIQET
jgi:hypothetical protein